MRVISRSMRFIGEAEAQPTMLTACPVPFFGFALTDGPLLE